MKKNKIMASAAIGAAAVVLAGAGGYCVRASAQAAHAGAADAASRAPQSFADIVARVSPAVVSIDVEGRADSSQVALSGQNSAPFFFQFGAPGGDGSDNPFGFDLRKMFPQAPDGGALPPVKGSGSGFFISPDGYIVTNNHVVAGATKITVRLNDDRSFKARLIGRDPATDIAVIKVEGGDFPFVDFENRAQPRVGDWVLAVGNPFGLGGTATAGIVSALQRKNISDSSYVDYMQIDAPINRGNSGGPSFDVYGRVVGVNTAIYTPSGGSVGIGFDIPADVAASVSRQLISNGRVVRGYIGATIQTVTPEIANSLGLSSAKGALVADLTPDGPAQRSGVKPGDLILQVNGHEVDSAADVTRQVALARAGETIRLEIRRDGRLREADVHSGVRPPESELADKGGGQGRQAPSASPLVLGMRLAPNTRGGVTIKGLSSGSDAAEKGLQPGDVILRVADDSVATPSQVSEAVARARQSGRKDVLLLVAHNGHRMFVAVDAAPANG